MRKPLFLALIFAASTMLGACTTYDRYGYGYDRYDNNRQIGRAATGAALGAAGGAALGAAVDGVSPIEGAAVGAVAGGVIGAVTSDNDRDYSTRGWYKDSSGYCYYVNQYGDRVYDYDRRC